MQSNLMKQIKTTKVAVSIANMKTSTFHLDIGESNLYPLHHHFHKLNFFETYYNEHVQFFKHYLHK